MVNDRDASVTFHSAQGDIITSAQMVCSATPSPPATSSLEASLKDLFSHIAGLSIHHATQTAPPPSLQVLAPSTPATPAKSGQQKKKLGTRVTNRD